MGNIDTRKFFSTPSAMAVALPAELADKAAFHLAPLPLLRVAHVHAACERMVVTKPLVVVALASAEAIEFLRERAEDVGAEVAELDLEMTDREVKATLLGAKARADER